MMFEPNPFFTGAKKENIYLLFVTGNIEMVKLLRNNGADINQSGKFENGIKQTPLDTAARYGKHYLLSRVFIETNGRIRNLSFHFDWSILSFL